MFACLGACRPDLPNDPNLSTYMGTDVAARLLTPTTDMKTTKPVLCQKCGGPTVEVCPSCHCDLPPGWRKGTTLCVALVGPRYTGKSNYIGVLVQALRRFAEASNMAFAFATSASEECYQKQYYEPMYVHGKVLAPTARMPRPAIIVSLTRHNGAVTFIVLRDIAGEDWEAAENPTYLGFMKRASLLIFLFDPLKVPNIAAIVRTLIPITGVGGEAQKVLTHMLAMLGDSKPRLAICLSKFDVLWKVGELGTIPGANGAGHNTLPQIMSNTGAAFHRDSRSLSAATIQEDLRFIDQEIRSLLTVLKAGNLVTTIDNSKLPARFFAVSQLGHAPDTQGLNSHGIAPYRVLDPLLWALSEEGMLS